MTSTLNHDLLQLGLGYIKNPVAATMSTNVHEFNGNAVKPPFPQHLRRAMFGMGCFWGAEKLFWNLKGVYSTMVGYSGGDPCQTPTYNKMVSGQCPKYAEVVRVIYDPKVISYENLLKHFWEGHNPMQGHRQGNDMGEHYRSCVFCYDDNDDVNSADTSISDLSTQGKLALNTLDVYQWALREAGHNLPITTEIRGVQSFHYAEQMHQQYLYKNSTGYCSLVGTGATLIL